MATECAAAPNPISGNAYFLNNGPHNNGQHTLNPRLYGSHTIIPLKVPEAQALSDCCTGDPLSVSANAILQPTPSDDQNPLFRLEIRLPSLSIRPGDHLLSLRLRTRRVQARGHRNANISTSCRCLDVISIVTSVSRVTIVIH